MPRVRDILRTHARDTLVSDRLRAEDAFVTSADLARIRLGDWIGPQTAWEWRDRVLGQRSNMPMTLELGWSKLWITRSATKALLVDAYLLTWQYDSTMATLQAIEYELDRRNIEQPRRDTPPMGD